MITNLFILQLIAHNVMAKTETVTVKTLCEDSWVTSADRLANDTIRVYRDNHYWDLIGVGDESVKPLGPYPVSFKYMAPVSKTSKVMTIVGGTIEGTVWKFDNGKYWQWRPDGSLVIGGKGGTNWPNKPGFGFECIYNDGDLDEKGYPMMIGFKGTKVYYWKTYSTIFQPVGDVYNGYTNGQFDEKFPSDLTACAAVKLANRKAKYSVLLFKKRQYCLRPVKGEEGCKEWRQNTKLFRCETSNDNKPSDPSDTDPTPLPEDKPPADKPKPEPGKDNQNDNKDTENSDDVQDCSGQTGLHIFSFLFFVILNVFK